MIVNPCDKCLIDPMCKEYCEGFYNYIIDFLRKYRDPHLDMKSEHLISTLAYSIRTGSIVLSKVSRWGYIILPRE